MRWHCQGKGSFVYYEIFFFTGMNDIYTMYIHDSILYVI